jgi:glutamate/aspartate transport system permease protein
MSYQWNWHIFLQDTGADETYLHWLMTAWGWTLAVSVAAWFLALVLGSAVGVLRTVPSKPLQAFASGWVELFRNIPVLVQTLLWYFVVPAFVPWIGHWSPFWLGTVALALFTSARIAEQVRSGILALPRGQRMAGLALGLTLPQTYRHVILPMALRIVLPPLTSEAMNIIKNSTVVMAVSVAEMIQFAMQAQEETGHGVEVYLGVTALYIVSALIANRVMVFIEHAVRVPGYVGGGK